jgi:hypothetical protein
MHGTTCPKKRTKPETRDHTWWLYKPNCVYTWPSPADSEEGLLVGTREKCSQESTLKMRMKVSLEKILNQNKK